MWKPWRNNNLYTIPKKPQEPNRQLGMIWDCVFNHLPGILTDINRRSRFQDIKINFILAFLALLLAGLAWQLFG